MAYPNIMLSRDTTELIVGGAVMGLLIFLFSIVRWIWNRYNSGLLGGIHGRYPVRREVEQNKEIYNELLELKVLTEADRASVFRFHNGTEFLPSHPAWKISCTHEIVKHGLTYESARLQGILVSLVPNIVGPILTGISTTPGISLPQCMDCPFRKKCIQENKRMVVIQVDEMESSFTQFHLQGANIKTVVMCGIAVGGNVYGTVGVNFCDAKLSPDRLQDVVQKVCRATDKIHYYLQYKKAPVDLPRPSRPITSPI